MSSTLKQTDWTPIAESDTRYDVFSRPINISAQDDRSYRLIKLENGLQALLISDPTSDKAAASLNVQVGHLADPDDRPGLAHFCEHLLFMGTKQYPKENAYSEFISQNGGRTNAYTSTTTTNYHFDISPSALTPALERFSTFFHSPLFSSSCTARELEAVDSENKKNRQNDQWRAFQLDKSLCRPGARWGKFGSGNWESLMGRKRTEAEEKAKSQTQTTVSDSSQADQGDGGVEGRETRRKLLDWYHQHYSADRMTLSVLGKETLDELSVAVSKFFSPIPKRDSPLNSADTITSLDFPMTTINSPWGPDQEGSTIFLKTVQDFHGIEFRWVIPRQSLSYRTKPAQFLSHFIGHEGAGSIHSVLKKKGWLVNLATSSLSGDRDNGFDFFRVAIILTKEGWDNYTIVADTVHAYISLLRSSPLPAWHQDEIKTIASTAFRFAERGAPDNYVTHCAESLAKPFAREDVVSGPRLVYEWDERSVRDLLDIMGPEKARTTLMGREGWEEVKHDGGKLLSAKGREWLKERWYGTEYLLGRSPAPKNIETSEGLALPRPNAFIPTNFDVEKKEVSKPLKRPLKIRETPSSTLWYKKDDTFWVPKASFSFEIKSPLFGVTPRHSAMSRLFGDLVRDALNESTYDADLAGLSFTVQGTQEGLTVLCAGYNDKLSVLLETVIKEIKGFRVDHERFVVLKEQVRQEWENKALSQPYELASTVARQILWERVWTTQERLNELEFITAEDVQGHINSVLTRTHVEGLIHGNMRKDEAIRIAKSVDDILGSRSLTPMERVSMRSLILPSGCNYVYTQPVPNKADVNSGLTYYCQIGDDMDPVLRATLIMLAQIAREPCFNQLRTKEQLGYIVHSSTWPFTGSIGFNILLQSERDPVYLESRVDAFLDQLRTILEEMNDEDFEKERKSAIDKQLERLKNQREEADRFWVHIDSGYHNFRQREIFAEKLKDTSRADVLTLFNTYIHPSSPTRSKLSVHSRSQTAPSPRLSIKASAVLLEHLKAAGIPVEEVPYNAAAAMELSVDLNQTVWTQFFAKDPSFDKTVAADLVKLIDTLAKKYPAAARPDGTSEVGLPGGTEFIDDIANLKARLTLSKAATPVEIYSDLVGSKL